MSVGSFDETDIESWSWGSISSQEATSQLEHEETGTFLLRDSSTFQGDYVLCVKERTGVVQYVIHSKKDDSNSKYLREEMCFPDLTSLLRFYKVNLLGTTPLIKPKEAPARSRPSRPPSSPCLNGQHQDFPARSVRASAPPGLSQFSERVYARAVKPKRPSAYDRNALELKPGDIIMVTKRCSTGQWIGIKDGKEGSFPGTHVEILDNYETSISE